MFAGFWDLYEHAVLDYQSPLKNFGETIHIGALTNDACYELAVEPMRSLQLKYANPTIVDELIHMTGQRANLIAVACNEMIGALYSDKAILESEDVHNALRSTALRNAMRGWNAMTDNQWLNRLDSAVVYSMIDHANFTYGDLIDKFETLEVSIDNRKIEDSLERLKLGFILSQSETNNYFFQVPLFQQWLQSEDPEIKLKNEIRILKQSKE